MAGAARGGPLPTLRTQSTCRVILQGGQRRSRAVLTTYQANSEPNAVTGQQYRLDVQRYSLYRHGKEIVIGLRSPVGADNVDPWRIVTQSFTWG